MGVKAPPFEVAGLTELTQVTGTDGGSCVLKSPGTAFCWANSYGSYAAAPVSSLTGMKQVLLGRRSCVLTAENTVSCGPLSALTPFPGLVGIRQVSSGWLHSCVLTAQNTVLCWGENQVGQLGNGTGLASTQPVLVPGLSRIKQISTGDSHTCALSFQGSVFCWGSNLGPAPIEISGLQGVKQVSANYDATCALTAQDTVMCWGFNGFGQLGNNSTTASILTPVRAGVLQDIAYLSDGTSQQSHFCAVTRQNVVHCWGRNTDYQVAPNSVTLVLSPVVVQGF